MRSSEGSRHSMAEVVTKRFYEVINSEEVMRHPGGVQPRPQLNPSIIY